MTTSSSFYNLLREVVGAQPWSHRLQVDVRRQGALGLVYDVTIDGRPAGCFTGDELAAQHQLAEVLHSVTDGYGDGAA
jgi:hypothetical protein